MNKRILITGIVGLMFTTLGAYFGAKRTEPNPPETSAVSALWATSMPDSDGTRQSLSKWQGQALIVNFWATWCAPCVDEMPELSNLQGEVAGDNIQIIGIGIDSATNIAEFASKYKIAYPLYVGGIDGTALSRQLGNPTGGLPFTVLIDSKGAVKKTYLGRLKMPELRQDLDLIRATTKQKSASKA